MTLRFEPDTGDASNAPPPAPANKPRFELSPEDDSRFEAPSDPAEPETDASSDEMEAPSSKDGRPPLLSAPDSDAWRREVAARVSNFRSRKRTKGPRYPSLMLQFDPPAPRTPPAQLADDSAPPPVSREAVALAQTAEVARPEAAQPRPRIVEPAETAKIIEFPRFTTMPAPPLDQLADPVLDTPRILEVPEVLPPPPAMGGILIEPVEPEKEEKRPGFEIPLNAAPLSRRVTAGVVDAVLVLLAFALFAYVFFRVSGIVPAVQMAAEVSVGLLVFFWSAYCYGMLVYAGSTPGLKLARLSISRFDGSPVPQARRRWRVWASLLSGVSLGLGYLWCFLDEDQLCWHDRITNTYLAPLPPKAKN
jgi:uncharacterized RDD family membrane protein YckC